MAELACAAPVGDRVGEGAVWTADEQALYWVDINRFLIHRYDPADGAVRTFFFDEPVTALALATEGDRMVAALGSRLIVWRPASDQRSDHGFALEGWPKVRFNDGRADPRGDFWIGSMGNNLFPDGESGEVAPGLGKLFRVRSGKGEVMVDGVGIANTICWSPDGTRFYFADTMANTVSVYDYKIATGGIGNPRAFFNGYQRGLPDGSAVDAEGCLWNCRFGGGCAVRIRPGGAIDRVVEVPSINVTTCTFGGPDLKTLYITTAAHGGKRGERLAGSLFALRVEVPGLPENRVRL